MIGIPACIIASQAPSEKESTLYGKSLHPFEKESTLYRKKSGSKFWPYREYPFSDVD